MRILGSALVASVIVVACSSSGGSSSGASSGNPVPDVPDRKISEKEIGPEGGTLTGERLTIEVPAGAVTEKRLFTINGVAETRVGLPIRVKANKPGAYALGPDDVTFAKPITLRLTLDKAKVDEIGRGGFYLYRSEAVTNDWQKLDAQVNEASELVGTTTHFSWTTDAANPDLSCITNRKTCETQGGGPSTDPTTLLAMDCHIPFLTKPDDKGIHCTSAGNGAPYECRCNGASKVLKTFKRYPDDKFLMANAKDCGGSCPAPKPPPACIEVTCSGSKTPGEAWSCTGTRGPSAMTCSFAPKTSASCSCDGGKTSFPIANGSSGVPTPEDLQEIMSAKCGEIDCRPPGSPPGVDAGPPPPDDWVCMGAAGPADGTCKQMTMTTCRDGRTYDTYCPLKQPGDQQCDCIVDDVVTKKVTGSCEKSPWAACGFPKRYGDP